MLVGKWNIDQLVETTGTKGGIDLVRSISGADDKGVLRVHAVHLRQDLVENTVTGTSSIARRSATRFCDRIQLVKEHDTWSRSTGFIKNVTNICFRFSEPHRQEFGSLWYK